MKLVALTESEVAQAMYLGHERGYYKARYASTKLWSPDSVEAVTQHVWGLLGEIAVARVSGGSIDTRLNPMGDGGAGDVYLPSGEIIEVKTRGQWGWDWATSTDDPNEIKAPFIALVWPEPGPVGKSEALKRVRLAVMGIEHDAPSWAWAARQAMPITMTVVGWMTTAEFTRHATRVNYGHGTRFALGGEWFDDDFHHLGGSLWC